MKSEDLKIFDASFFEDTVYGARTELKISDFLRQQYNEYNQNYRIAVASPLPQLTFGDMLNERLQGKSCIIQGLILLCLEREALRVKLWYKLQGRPLLFKLCKKIYHILWGK